MLLHFLVSIVELIILSNDTALLEGESVSLTCVGRGDPEISWSRNGQVLSNTSDLFIHEEDINDEGRTLTQSFLQLCNLVLADAGTYTCVVSNSIRSVNSSVQLTVTGTYVQGFVR